MDIRLRVQMCVCTCKCVIVCACVCVFKSVRSFKCIRVIKSILTLIRSYFHRAQVTKKLLISFDANKLQRKKHFFVPLSPNPIPPMPASQKKGREKVTSKKVCPTLAVFFSAKQLGSTRAGMGLGPSLKPWAQSQSHTAQDIYLEIPGLDIPPRFEVFRKSSIRFELRNRQSFSLNFSKWMSFSSPTDLKEN